MDDDNNLLSNNNVTVKGLSDNKFSFLTLNLDTEKKNELIESMKTVIQQFHKGVRFVFL